MHNISPFGSGEGPECSEELLDLEAGGFGSSMLPIF